LKHCWIHAIPHLVVYKMMNGVVVCMHAAPTTINMTAQSALDLEGETAQVHDKRG
jgi:hypothetical protein